MRASSTRRPERKRPATPTPASRSSPTSRCLAWTARTRSSAPRTAGASDRAVIPDVATAPPARGRLLERLPPVATLGPLVALFLACAFFASQSDRFLSGSNFSLILQQVMVVGVVAIGQTLVILTAGIDLSCGMLMALGGIVMSRFAVAHGLPPSVAILCGLGVCMLFGLLNGLLVTKVKLPS